MPYRFDQRPHREVGSAGQSRQNLSAGGFCSLGGKSYLLVSVKAFPFRSVVIVYDYAPETSPLSTAL
ncbi:hypothetical protein [Desmospora activa]|uniref:hypothetical protein n=1 Tax=Desmospora activa TaxID=500615 RepID=UPI000D2FC086|nr:hypothetical protein [Desmospora activa]